MATLPGRLHLVIILACALALSGCVAQGAPTNAHGEPAVDPATAPEPTASGLPPAIALKPAAKPPTPMVFRGHIVAPDPFVHENGICGGDPYNGPHDPSDATRDVTWQQFVWGFPLEGWTYSFDVDGLVAFNQAETMALPSGAVPPGSRAVSVCSPDRADLDYTLTLTPPGPVVFAGHALAANLVAGTYGHCHGFYVAAYDEAMAPLTTSTFTLSHDYTGWSYSVDRKGLLVEFHPNEGTPLTGSGTVPANAYEVLVCNRSAVDTDFQLKLTPP